MAAQGAPAWNVAYEVDFRALPSQSIGTDGNHLIGDRTWTKTDSVDASLFEVQPGIGLLMRCSTGTSILQMSWTNQFANISIPLGNLIEGYDSFLDYLFQMHITSNNADVGTTVTNNASVGVSMFIGGLAGAPLGSSNRSIILCQRSQSVGAGPFSYSFNYDSSTLTPSTSFPISAYNTMCLHNQAHGNSHYTFSLGNRVGDDWPEQSALSVVASGNDGTSSQIGSHNDSTDSYVGIGLAAGLGNNTGTFQATVAGLRVLVKPQQRRIRLAS